MSISSIQEQLPFSTQPFHQDISPKLNKVRSGLLRFSELSLSVHIPMHQSVKIREIISEYVGPDKNQEADVARTFSSIQSDRRAYELFNNVILSEAKILNNSLICGIKDNNILNKCIHIFEDTLKKLIESDPSIGDQSIMETSIDEHMYVTLFSNLITKAENFIVSDKNIAFFRQFLRTLYVFRLAQISAETGFALSKRDHSHIYQWIQRIVILQQHATVFLQSPKGSSQGITYSIKNGNEVCGYLYSTIHNNRNRVDQISVNTQKRLAECAILGTELNHSISYSDGVEKELVLRAYEWGLAMTGIDDRRLFGEEETHLVSCNSSAVKFLLNQWMILHAYYTGNKDRMIMLSKNSETIAPLQNQEYLLIERNHIMTENMDLLLKACDKVAQEKRVAPIKCFFAVGFLHVIPYYSCNLVELLQKKGWTLEYVTPKPVPLRYRCRSITNCLFSFGFTLGRAILSTAVIVVNQLRKK